MSFRRFSISFRRFPISFRSFKSTFRGFRDFPRSFNQFKNVKCINMYLYDGNFKKCDLIPSSCQTKIPGSRDAIASKNLCFLSTFVFCSVFNYQI